MKTGYLSHTYILEIHQFVLLHSILQAYILKVEWMSFNDAKFDGILDWRKL